jgi:hypothetical protein
MDYKFSLAQINVTDYLIVRLRKVTDPTTEVDRQVLGPHPPANNNLVFVDLDPDYYFVDVYESPNGTTLIALFNTFEINTARGSIISELRYYVVDRGGEGEPADGTTVLDDPYFTGKTISFVAQRGYDNLRPPSDIVPEWDRTDSGIALMPPLVFSSGDTYTVGITYEVVSDPPVTQKGPFSDEKTVVANVTTDSSFYNKAINCIGTSDQLVVTIDSLGNIPDKTQFLFNDQGDGAANSQQHQTVIKMQGIDKIRWANRELNAIWIGRGEVCQLKKINGRLKVMNEMAGMIRLGTRFSDTTGIQILNSLAEDGAVYDADDYPRIWWFINTWLTEDEVDTTYDFVALGTAGRDQSRIGQFMISAAHRQFAMPDTRNMSEKGLKQFDRTQFGNDSANRAYDYPGGVQAGQVGQFPFDAQIVQKAGTGNRFLGLGIAASGGDPVDLGKQTIQINQGKENRVKNYGVVYRRWI